MTWWTATSVSVNNGQTIVNVNTGDDVQIAQEAGGLVIGNQPPVEIKRTFLDGSNNKKIELRLPWPYANQTNQPAVAFPTDADLAEATRVLRAVGSDAVTFAEALSQVLSSTAATLTIQTETSGDVTVVPYGRLTQQVQALLNTFGDFGVPLYDTDTKNQARTLLGLQPQITAQPTLDLDFANNDLRVYEPFGLTRKTLTEAITTTRNSVASYNSPFGVATAAANEPRIEYNPTTGECLGLLCEEQRTNLLLWSEKFDNAVWGKTRTTITPNVITAPDGTITGEKLVENNENNSHLCTQTTGLTANTTYTISVYAKAAERPRLYLQTANILNWQASIQSVFDLVSGQMVSGSGQIVDVGNGWFRCSITATFGSSNLFGGMNIAPVQSGSTTPAYQGDGTSGIYIWGAQLEVGSFPTSYIKTEGSQVTRVFEYITANSIQQSSAISIVFDVFDRVPTTTPSGRNATIISLNDGTSDNRLVLRRDPGTSVNLIYNVADANNLTGVNLFNRNAFNRVGIRVSALGVATIFINGAVSNSVTSSNPRMIPFNRFDIGHDRNQSFSRFDGVYKNMKIFPRALSDQELIDLTRL